MYSTHFIDYIKSAAINKTCSTEIVNAIKTVANSEMYVFYICH